MKTRKGVALLTLAAGLAALPATGAGAVDVATYSVTAFERTSTITLNGTNDGGGQFSGRSRTTYKFSGRRGKNKISIDFRNRRNQRISMSGFNERTGKGRFTARIDANVTFFVPGQRFPPANCVLSGTLPDERFSLDFEGPGLIKGNKVKIELLGPDAVSRGPAGVAEDLGADEQPGCQNQRFYFNSRSERDIGDDSRGAAFAWRSLDVSRKTLRKKANRRPKKVVIRGTKRSPVYDEAGDRQSIGTQITKTKITMWLVSNKPVRTGGGISVGI